MEAGIGHAGKDVEGLTHYRQSGVNSAIVAKSGHLILPQLSDLELMLLGVKDGSLSGFRNYRTL